MPARIDPRTRRRVRTALLAWYAAGHRDFPWRSTSDPYAVLVSEVMLQQTQAARVAARFTRFMGRFPTAASLAAAPSADLLAEWSGLGYNRRALALQRAATTVSREGWPREIAGLAALPGVGPYTARAVASLAFDVTAGVVDTNVRRWLLRRFGGPDEPRRLQALADALAAPGVGAEVAAWTHATMEFGAGVCRSHDPRCNACPIARDCPSRGAAGIVPVPRQLALRGSDRAYRGAILRLLSETERHALDEKALRTGLAVEAGRIGAVLDEVLDDRRWERIVGALEADGLVHRMRGAVRLGLATIGA